MKAVHLWLALAVFFLLAAGSLVFASAQLTWHRQGHTAVLPQQVILPSGDTTAAQSFGIGTIAALAPFGQTVSATPDPSETRDSRLGVVLRGVLVDPDPSQSRAFLLSGGRTEVYRIGDTVQSAELVAVNSDTVTVKTEERLVVIGFDGPLGQNETAEPMEVAVDADNPTDPLARLAASIVPGKGSIDLREAPPPETTEEYIALWRERITRNPQAAMDTVGVELVENGYRIKPDPNIGVTLAGLRPGDVVSRLNGQAVGDLEKDRELYDQVAASGIARLEVLRDGQALLLTFPLR